MMMSKPQPSETAENPPAEKAKGPSDAVADLERRLQMLSGGDNDPPPPTSVAEAQQPPSFATPPVTTAPVAPAAAATGKSALLVSNVGFEACRLLVWSIFGYGASRGVSVQLTSVCFVLPLLVSRETGSHHGGPGTC